MRPSVMELKGPFMPLVTPFTDDGMTISEIRLSRMMRWAREAGMRGYIVASEVGEFTSLSASERKHLLELTMRELRCDGDVLVNVSTLSTVCSLDLAQHAGRHGARAAIVMPPYFGEFCEDEIVSFLQAICVYGKVPVILVDPMRVATPEVLDRLKDLPALHVAKSIGSRPTRTDDFVMGEMWTNPGIAIEPSASVLDPRLIELVAFAGRAKVAKAALEFGLMEVGPPRGPLKRLSGDSLKALHDLLTPPTRLEA